MMRKLLSLILLLLVVATSACGQNKRKTSVAVNKPMSSSAKELGGQSKESLRADIGEMLLVGFRGTEVGPNDHIYRDIKEHKIGGVILFDYDAPSGKRGRNIKSYEQLQSLCTSLQAINEDPLFIAIDQEGGRVSRLKSAAGFPTFISAAKMAEKGIDSVRYYANLTAKTLKDLGINLNFAPCADLNVNPDCPIIGKLERSFSKRSDVVAECCNIWIKEQSAQGVMSCLKHFPGHGSASGDTHQGLVDISDTWHQQELYPYQRLIEEGDVPMVMIAHVMNKSVCGELPASLSVQCVKMLLREKMGYNGLVITDDLAMGAIVKQFGQEEALYLALQAGSDILCLSNNGTSYDADLVPNTIETILKMVEEGKLSASEIHKKAERIRIAKSKMFAQRNNSTQTDTKQVGKEKNQKSLK